MQKLIQALNFIMAVLLSIMGVLLFINVILRYAFHSGIGGAEDISRFSFIWFTYIGVIVMLAIWGNLGVDFALQRVPRRLRFALGLAGRLLMALALSLFVHGSWNQVMINDSILSQGAIQYPLSWNYMAGVIAGVGGILFVIRDIIYLLKGNGRPLVFIEVEADVQPSINESGRA